MLGHGLLEALLDPPIQPLALRVARLRSVAWRHASAAKLVGNLPPDAEIAGEGILGDERLEGEAALGGLTAMAIETESSQQRANGIGGCGVSSAWPGVWTANSKRSPASVAWVG